MDSRAPVLLIYIYMCVYICVYIYIHTHGGTCTWLCMSVTEGRSRGVAGARPLPCVWLGHPGSSS